MTISSRVAHTDTGSLPRRTPAAAVPLSMAPAGQILQLETINAGKRLTHRLAELGLTPGVSLTIVQDAGGPLLIAVRGSRIAMGRGLAHKLLVMVI